MPQAELGAFNFSDFNNVAILRYKGAECEEPDQEPWVDVPKSKLPLVETNLHVSCASLFLISSSTRLTLLTIQPLVATPVV